MTYVLLGAMECELERFIRSMQINVTDRTAVGNFHIGKLGGQPMVLGRSGVGKVMAAMVTQHAIDRFAPKAVIVTGLAGALNPEFDLGDIVLSRDCMQHDLDCGALGFARGQVPYSDHHIFTADSGLLDGARSFRSTKHGVHIGRILSGDQFVNGAHRPEWSHLRQDLKGDAVEMEGASVALVCAVNRIPFLVVRTISDRADGSAVGDFSERLATASENSFAVVTHLLERHSFKS